MVRRMNPEVLSSFQVISANSFQEQKFFLFRASLVSIRSLLALGQSLHYIWIKVDELKQIFIGSNQISQKALMKLLERSKPTYTKLWNDSSDFVFPHFVFKEIFMKVKYVSELRFGNFFDITFYSSQKHYKKISITEQTYFVMTRFFGQQNILIDEFEADVETDWHRWFHTGFLTDLIMIPAKKVTVKGMDFRLSREHPLLYHFDVFGENRITTKLVLTNCFVQYGSFLQILKQRFLSLESLHLIYEIKTGSDAHFFNKFGMQQFHVPGVTPHITVEITIKYLEIFNLYFLKKGCNCPSKVHPKHLIQLYRDSDDYFYFHEDSNTNQDNVIFTIRCQTISRSSKRLNRFANCNLNNFSRSKRKGEGSSNFSLSKKSKALKE